jgi:hypothetical protein
VATIVTVTIDRVVFLHKVSDLSVYLKLKGRQLGEATSGTAEERLYGRGNVRSRSAPGILRTLDLMFDHVVRADRETLTNGDNTGWVDTNEFLMLRDPRGRVVYGSFKGKSLQVTEYPAVDLSSITATFAVVTPPPALTVTV